MDTLPSQSTEKHRTDTSKHSRDILSFSYDTLQKELAPLGEPSFRGEQIFSWLHEKNVVQFEEMTNLPLPLRESLAQRYDIHALSVQTKQVSQQDGTIKYLFSLPDGQAIETVLMKYHHGNSLCISTQVGCRMGCNFCASTLNGKVRNLTPGEMLGQIYGAERESGERVSNVVLMGIGEPLDNFENVISFLQTISSPRGKNISLRSIAVSTCGVVDKIYQLAEYKFPITLSISLHATTDEQRNQIMPINRRWNIESLLTAAEDYFKATGRRVTYEYSLIAGVNDKPEEAHRLAQLLQKQKAHINLIPINPIEQRDYRQSGERQVKSFAKVLQQYGLQTTIRRELGRDIDAACGQLRHKEIQ